MSKQLDFLEEIHNHEKKMNANFAKTIAAIEKSYRKDLDDLRTEMTQKIEKRSKDLDELRKELEQKLEKRSKSEKKPLSAEECEMRFKNTHDKIADVEKRYYDIRDQLTDLKRHHTKRSLMFTGCKVPVNCPREDLLFKMIDLIDKHYKVKVDPKEVGQVCCFNLIFFTDFLL